MASAILGFNEQLERIAMVGVVLLVGGMIYPALIRLEALGFVPLLFLVIRPLSIWIGLIDAGMPRIRRVYMSWFGIRGIESIYYLAYAMEHGLPGELAARFVNITFVVVAVVHHRTRHLRNPLMERYRRRIAPETS